MKKKAFSTYSQQWLVEKGRLVHRELLLDHMDARFKTLVNSCSASASGTWTSALPSPFNETFMPPAAYRSVLRYRTDHPIFSTSYHCLACKQRVSDATGDHDFFYQGVRWLIRRHNHVRDKLFALAHETRLAPRLEFGHMFDDDPTKPADIIFPSGDNGRDLCLDVFIVSPFTFLPLVGGVGEAAWKSDEQNSAKYEANCVSNGILFRPFVMESTSGFGQRTDEVLSDFQLSWHRLGGCHRMSLLSPLGSNLPSKLKNLWPTVS